MDEPTTKLSKVNRGLAGWGRGAAVAAGGVAATAGSPLPASKRISSSGNPAAAASRARRAPCLDAIQSAKTRDGTETVRTPAPAVWSNCTWRVGPNQVFSSFGSSLSSTCLRMELQISVMAASWISTRFPQLWKACGSPGGGEYMRVSKPGRRGESDLRGEPIGGLT